ncbi:MAG: amino acid adenylation domain-containing protein [Prevotella sp.]|nr:amino acid adenylation domain-containing protein [Prevotella sp.]
MMGSIAELHTRFVVGAQGELRQWCDLSMTIPVVSRHCSEAELQAYISRGFVRPFRLFSGEPLFRVEVVETEQRLCLLSDGHHAIVDGMSFAPILTSAFARAMEGEVLEPQPYGMYQAAEAEAASFATESYQRAKAYYAEKFAGLKLATLSSQRHGSMGKMGRRSALVSRRLCDEWCQRQGVAVNLLFQAAFSHAVGVLTRQERVAYFTVNHGRMDKRLRSSVGMFVRSVPFLADGSGDPTVADYIRRLRTELMSTIRHGIYPFTHFCMDLDMTPGVMFNFQAMASMEERLLLGDMELEVVQPVREEMDGDAGVLIFCKGDSYEIRVESGLAMNSEPTLQMLADAIGCVAGQMMARPDAPLSQIGLITPEQQQALVRLGAGKRLPVDRGKTFVAAFEDCARQMPDRLAVADGTRSMTYGELSHRSDVLAHRLSVCGVRPNDFVAVMLDRTVDFPLAVIAIHKAGAAYVPIDLEYPEERRQYMLRDCGAKVVVDRQFIADTDFAAEASPMNLSTPDGLAYMIYTSGSTGRPKGAVLHQAGLRNAIASFIHTIGLTAADRMAAHRSFSFDAHVDDVFPILTLGGTVYIMPEQIRRDLGAIRQFLYSNQITVMGLTTSLAVLLLNAYQDLPLRILAAGGEKLHDVYSDHITIVNSYGPTECSNDVSYYIIEPGERPDCFPIGRPGPNSWFFLVDRDGRLVPRGAVGELCFAGIQVGRGYWQQPELTEAAFTICPFLPVNDDGTPVPMYRTGDLGCWDDDGQMLFLGRKDDQVKVHGYRIELGEIEACATRYEGISQAVAVITQVGGNNVLCLYYTADRPIDKTALRDHLSGSLAEYMVPMAYMQLDSFPQTPNGKTDRRHLPEPEFMQHIENVAPATEKESLLLLIARQVLERSDFGTTDDLIALGLTSIGVIRLAVMASASGVKVSVNDLMRQRTIARTVSSSAAPGCWYNGYSPDKPVLVVPHGIVYAINMAGKLSRWQKRFSIYTIEPTDEHADRLFHDADFCEMIDAYAQMLDHDIPREASVFGFIGYSWGGEQAYWLAQRWHELRGACPNIYLGDSQMHDENYVKMSDEDIVKEATTFATQHHIDLKKMDEHALQAALQLAIKKVGTAAQLHCSQPFPTYDGHVTLFQALRGNSDWESNQKKWRRVAPMLKVVDVDDRHLDFVLGDQYIDLVTEELFGDLDNEQQAADPKTMNKEV